MNDGGDDVRRVLEATDIVTMDRVLAAIQSKGDRLSVILDAIIDSPPFQRMRPPSELGNRQIAGTSTD